MTFHLRGVAVGDSGRVVVCLASIGIASSVMGMHETTRLHYATRVCGKRLPKHL
jgi:hypothetical protein